MSSDTYKYRGQAISAAKDLLYPKSVIDMLKKATTDNQIADIMSRARYQYAELNN